METYVKSPLNYTGGKHKLLPQIHPLFPKEIDTFYDLFGGGFNVGINVVSQKHVYNDILQPVAKLLQYLYDYGIDYTLGMIDGCIRYFELSKTNSEGYYRLRDHYNETPESYAFYTLVCHSFNNQIRFNQKGEFNMPFGKNRSSFNPTLRQRFITFVERLQTLDVEFHSKDFRLYTDIPQPGDFVYLDPPYLLSTATYNEQGGWTVKDEEDLYVFLETLTGRGVKWALSNVLYTKGSHNEILNKWLLDNSDKLHTHILSHNYKNSNYQRDDSKPDIEVLVTNYKE